MKKAWYILFFAFFIFILYLFKPREDIVFGAVNESQYIRLFEDGRDFQLCLKPDEVYNGTYTILKDTVYLTCQEHVELSRLNIKAGQPDKNIPLQLKLYINNGSSEIGSTDGPVFSAQIYLDKRQKLYNPESAHKGLLNSQTISISALGTGR
jgi:hypothetical protein